MRFLSLTMLLLAATPAYAMTQDEAGRCIIESPPGQTAYGIFQDAVTLLYGNKLESLANHVGTVITRLEDDRIKDCQQVADIFLEETSKTLKQLLAKQK